MTTSSELLFHTVIHIPYELGHVVKKNNRPLWKGRIGKSMRLMKAEAHLKRELSEIVKKDQLQPITDFIHAEFTFLFPRPKVYIKATPKKPARISKILPDLSNLYELPQDILTEVGIIEDDRLIQSHDGSRIRCSESTEYFLQIRLYKMDFRP